MVTNISRKLDFRSSMLTQQEYSGQMMMAREDRALSQWTVGRLSDKFKIINICFSFKLKIRTLVCRISCTRRRRRGRRRRRRRWRKRRRRRSRDPDKVFKALYRVRLPPPTLALGFSQGP